MPFNASIDPVELGLLILTVVSIILSLRRWRKDFPSEHENRLKDLETAVKSIELRQVKVDAAIDVFQTHIQYIKSSASETLDRVKGLEDRLNRIFDKSSG
jgi:exonuclease VII small subunit